MNKSYLILGILILLVLPIVSADLDVYKSGTSIDLKIQCQNNNAYCSNSAICNLTVLNPSGTAVLNNGLMTNQLSFYNYTLSPSLTLTQGLYSGSVVCDDNGTPTSTSWQFTITPSGLTGLLGYSIVIFLVAYAIGFFGFFGKHEWISILGGLAMISIGIYTLINGIDVYRTTMTEGISLITIGLGAIFSLTAGVELIEDNMS